MSRKAYALFIVVTLLIAGSAGMVWAGGFGIRGQQRSCSDLALAEEQFAAWRAIDQEISPQIITLRMHLAQAQAFLRQLRWTTHRDEEAIDTQQTLIAGIQEELGQLQRVRRERMDEVLTDEQREAQAQAQAQHRPYPLRRLLQHQKRNR